MKRLAWITFLLWATTAAAQQALRTIDYAKSSVSFEIKNAGLHVDGSFKEYHVTVQFDPKTLSASRFEGTIKTKSIDTGIHARDNHLRKEEFFSVDKYPEIHFISTGLNLEASGYVLYGKLTIKDVTKEISMPLTVTKTGGIEKFEAKLTADRLDFHVGESSWIMSDEVMIYIQIATK